MQGTRGLSLFYLETKTEDGKYNGLEVQVCVHTLMVIMYDTGLKNIKV